MAAASDIFGTVFKNGTCTSLARIVGHNGVNLQQADFDLGSSSSSSGDCGPNAVYSVYLLDDQDADSRTVIAGHDNVPLDIAEIIFDELQTDAIWTEDELGYNFRHVPEVCHNPAFEIAGRRYLLEYLLWPVEGEVIIVRCLLDCI